MGTQFKGGLMPSVGTGGGGSSYSDEQALAAAKAGIPSSSLSTGTTSAVQAQMADVYPNGFDRSFLQNLLARVNAGERVRVEVGFDSTTVGAGAGTSGNTNIIGARVRGWPAQFVRSLIQMGINAQFESCMGEENIGLYTPQTYSDFDPRLVLTGGFARLQAAPGPAGATWLATTVGAKWSLTTATKVSAFDLFLIQGSGFGSATIDIDGTTIQTINLAGTNAIIRVRITSAQMAALATPAVRTINVTTTTASSVYVIGAIPWDSTVGGVDVIVSGFAGAFVTDQSKAPVGQPWYPGTAGWRGASLMAIDMAVLQGTINDARSNRDPAVYLSTFTALVNIYQNDGVVVVLMSGLKSIGTDTVQANGQTAQANIVAQVAAVAASKNLLYLDLSNRDGTLAQMQAKGWIAADNIHGTARLYADEGPWIARTLIKLAQG